MTTPANLIDADGEACRELINANPMVLVDFWAEWCGPCKAVKPMVARIAETYSWLTVVKVDIDANGAFADDYNVQSIPSLLLFKQGAYADRLVGKVPYIMIERVIAKHAPQ